jgi:crotonobetainyl-CoA:carnitine CoA-transferase CaiB-like acyl-CoA transferase
LLDVTLQDGTQTRLPGLPLQMDGKRFGLRHDLPKHGEHTQEILKAAGFADEEISGLFDDKVIA